MKVWSEIVSEDVIATHFECDDHRYQSVIVPIGEVAHRNIIEELTYLEKRAARKRQVREMRNWRESVEKNMEERQGARERLKEAGYDESDIPL